MRSFWVNLNMKETRQNKISRYYVLLDVLSKFGGTYASANAVFQGTASALTFYFIMSVISVPQRRDWFEEYENLIKMYRKKIPELKRTEEQQDEVHKQLADKAANLPIDTYLQADEVKRALDYFALKSGINEDPEIISQKEKIESIKNEPTKHMDGEYLLNFKRACSIMGIFTVGQEIEKAE